MLPDQQNINPKILAVNEQHQPSYTKIKELNIYFLLIFYDIYDKYIDYR